jgi:translation initiation factor IF-3
MRIHHRRRGGQYKKEEKILFHVNEQIRVPEVRVIDENGEALGVLTTYRALEIARERELDLVEVSPKAAPPVCKLINYGQFKYKKEKEARAQKAHSKKVDVKGIRLSVKMGVGDFDVRLQKGKAFMEEGHKLKLEIRLRGREKAHTDIAKARIQEYLDRLAEDYQLSIEQPITRSGGNVTAIIGRKD